MAYKIGQLKNQHNNIFITNDDYTFGQNYIGYDFIENIAYYISIKNIKINNFKPYKTYIVNIYLKNTTEKYLLATKAVREDNTSTLNFLVELAFVPRMSYTSLELELNNANENEFLSIVALPSPDVTFEILNNILPEDRLPLLQLGFQTRPGKIIIINNESIKIGKSGIFEIKKDVINITNVKIPSSVQSYILDYLYKDREEE